uniref:SAP30-binding protein n=1 Tax=Hyaloperonospora arabidopsidis (strain Emoy2) TaxID=559515 RepID=M4BKP4_HYAAE
MNSLGIEYGSSSSDEEGINSLGVTHSKPSSTPSSSPAAQASVDSVFTVSEKTDEVCLVRPSNDTAEQEVGFTDIDREADTPLTEHDLEAMLLQAGIPPAADSVAADNVTQQRIERFLRMQRERGQDFQTTLQDKKEVRNPYILEKVVEYFGIDELRSNFPKDKFDPHGLPLHEYVDVLAVEQKKRTNARAQRQLQQQRDDADQRQVQFVSANAR